MKLSILLLVLSIKLRLTARFSPAFRKLLRRKDFVLVIRSADQKQARTFIVSNGRFRSHAGSDRTADTELVWRDADTAVRIMLSGNELDSFSAIGRSQLRILGNFEYAMWFIDLAG